MTIHLSGRNVDVCGNIIHKNEPTNEIKNGILKIINFDLTKPTKPEGSKIAFITKNKIIRFTGL